MGDSLVQYFQFFNHNMICLDVQATWSWCHVFHIMCFALGEVLMELVPGKLGIYDMGGLDPSANQWLELVLP